MAVKFGEKLTREEIDEVFGEPKKATVQKGMLLNFGYGTHLL